jgi:2-dehydro-3-deoxyphosphogluconate aldolase/(4S)-4-hydroxy-2-oxoglutarate aldolase
VKTSSTPWLNMKSQFEQPLLDRIHSSGVIAVLVVDEVRHAVPLARALLAGGIDAMELTLRTPVALDALRTIRAEVPEMLAGIGTILTTTQVEDVARAGASFGVSPGTNPRIIEAARNVNLPFAPGVATPSDVEAALELGCRELKFFPAEPSGGLAFLRSMAAPYLHLGVRFVPLGGVSSANLEAYLKDPMILAVGGSWLAPRGLIASEDWDAITNHAAKAREIADRARQGASS